MIVAAQFKGDTHTDFQWLQHDHYTKTCGIIFSACKNHYIERLKNDPENEIVPALQNLRSFDHRVLQAFHDHLAAYWRKRFYHPQIDQQENINAWLFWLEDQMKEGHLTEKVFVGVCFLALDKYGDDEARVIQGLQSDAAKSYPLKATDYLRKIPFGDVLNLVYLGIALFFVLWIAQNALKNIIQFPLLILIITIAFSGIGIYAHRKELHELGGTNVHSWALKLLIIFSASFGIAFLLLGLMNFE